jgi:hypothetical protein
VLEVGNGPRLATKATEMVGAPRVNPPLGGGGGSYLRQSLPAAGPCEDGKDFQVGTWGREGRRQQQQQARCITGSGLGLCKNIESSLNVSPRLAPESRWLLRSALYMGSCEHQLGRLAEFNGKYIIYTLFKKEWWAYRRTYQGRTGDFLVANSLLDKCVSEELKLIIWNKEDLQEIWSTLGVCYECPKKYMHITEVLLPIVNFRTYKF